MQYITYELHWKRNPDDDTGKPEGFAPFALVADAGCTWSPGHYVNAGGVHLAYVLTGNADDIENHPGSATFQVKKENQALAFARSSVLSMGGTPAQAAAMYVDGDGYIIDPSVVFP